MWPFNRSETNQFLDLVRATHERKERASKWLGYYHDEQKEETLRLLRLRHFGETDFRSATLNIVRKIINRRAGAYRLAPKRTFRGMDQVAGERLYRDLNADVVLKRASRLTGLLKCALLRVAWSDGRPQLFLHTPNVLDVECADPEHPTRVIVTHPAAKPELIEYSDWTIATHVLRDARGNPISNDPNPYGALPFVPLFDYLPDGDQFFLPGGADLIEAQEAINVGLANLWRTAELQAHGQPWISSEHALSYKGTDLEFGPSSVIRLPADGKLGFAAPNAPLSEILGCIEFMMRQAAACNDCGSDIFDLSKRAESGSAKHAERIDLKEQRQDAIQLWRRAEQRLFDVIKLVVNTHAPGTIPDDAEMSVDFAELQDNLSEAEQLENTRAKVELGIWSPVDALMAGNPDGYSTREQAYAELLRRKEESAVLTTPL